MSDRKPNYDSSGIVLESALAAAIRALVYPSEFDAAMTSLCFHVERLASLSNAVAFDWGQLVPDVNERKRQGQNGRDIKHAAGKGR